MFADALRPFHGRHDQNRNLTRLEDAQRQVNRAARSDNDIQRRFRLSQGSAKLLICIGERWTNVRGSPEVLQRLPQCPSADDHDVGDGTQQAHHHPIVLI